MDRNIYAEPARAVSVLCEYDVVVAGGGPAGCAAAIYAARHGAKTLLIEKEGYLGGATVAQLVIPILSTNGVDFQGVWHEWAQALKKRNGITEITRQRRFNAHWYVGSVDPEMVKYAWDELLDEAGAHILHYVLVAGAIVGNGTIQGILVETKAGRRAILAKRVVDCTGDADVCAQAGVPWEQGVNGKPWAMGVSLNHRFGGVPRPPDYVPGHGVSGKGYVGCGRSMGNTPDHTGGLLRLLRVDPLDPWDLTRVAREGRAQIWERIQRRNQQSGQEGVYLVQTASQPGVRSSRRVHGIATATAQDAWDFRKYPDGIARSSWEIDIHPAESATGKGVEFESEAYKPHIERSKQGDYFDIRYGCIIAQEIDNLLVAGRCLSAEHEAQSSLRIQQTCMATGQAAGTAAAMSLKNNVTPRELDPVKVVTQLEKDRAAIGPAFGILRDLPQVERVFG
ncbi:FAD-dependent oxidoreductase [Candidatus Poribacteria bacterium]